MFRGPSARKRRSLLRIRGVEQNDPMRVVVARWTCGAGLSLRVSSAMSSNDWDEYGYDANAYSEWDDQYVACRGCSGSGYG